MKANNHFVPQFYLKNFSHDSDKNKIYTYQLLVSHENVPCWQPLSIKKRVALQKHLYTKIKEEKESDELEEWFDRNFEAPAKNVINKAIDNSRMTKEDWRILINFAALQRVRTPVSYIQNRTWQEETIPEILEKQTRELKQKLESFSNANQILNDEFNLFDEDFPIKVSTTDLPDGEEVEVNTEVLLGRSMWLSCIKRWLLNSSHILHQHKWTILLAPSNFLWITSDNPMLQLNCHSFNKYDLSGGWNSKGTEIILPLSPRHLLYTQIGNKVPKKGTQFSFYKAVWIQKFLAENAYREIYSYEQNKEILKIRKREVNRQKYHYEQQEWSEWHKTQTTAELNFSL